MLRWIDFYHVTKWHFDFSGAGMNLPYWDFTGSTLVTSNYIRLTPDIQSRSGAIWNSVVSLISNRFFFYHLKCQIINVNKKINGLFCSHVWLRIGNWILTLKWAGKAKICSVMDLRSGMPEIVWSPGQFSVAKIISWA